VGILAVAQTAENKGVNKSPDAAGRKRGNKKEGKSQNAVEKEQDNDLT
jgi:hypothetical protein